MLPDAALRAHAERCVELRIAVGFDGPENQFHPFVSGRKMGVTDHDGAFPKPTGPRTGRYGLRSCDRAARRADAAPTLCREVAATIVGTEGDDVLTGTAGPDVMVGLGGADTHPRRRWR